MSNPTPILNNINAFDATKGTAISFNIIGGTEIVRSNIVYIYDLSTNDLICTHLYISTESIHELPPNTDPSIVYADGKSSADFVNNKNYYLQIQTFTNTAGTAGGSGMSVAKTFWCLFNPALSVNAIPAAISTTSYNVGATYTTNITDVTIPVTNIIQQYKFDLYTATGTLVQTSGNIIGSGEQEGTSTTYNITYNFSGLVVNSSYYVIVTTTSTEGMTVSAQSNTFTVSIETPTMGGAIVNNNACDGYISVVSNLSSEYGGNVSGEIVSFETDSENVFTKLQVDLEPVQDLHGYDKPWVGGAGKNKLDEDILVNGNFDYEGSEYQLNVVTHGFVAIKSGQTYMWSQSGSVAGRYVRFYDANKVEQDTSARVSQYNAVNATFNTPSWAVYMRLLWYSPDGITASDIKALKPQIEEGSTATAWTPYTNICPISGWDEVETVRTGKNLLSFPYTDTSKVVGGITYTDNGDGTITANGTATSTAYFDLIKVISPRKIKAGTYTYSVNGVGGRINVTIYKNGNWVNQGSATDGRPITFTTQEDTTYYAFLAIDSGVTVNNQKFYIQLELGTTATAYEPYDGQTITTTLPTTVYGGTLDVVNGTLTVDRAMVDLGTLNFNYDSGGKRWQITIPDIYNYPSRNGNLVAEKYVADITASAGNEGKMFTVGKGLYIYSTDGTTPPSGNLVYPLATPQTYQLTPHQIQTLIGTNTISSNGSNITVSYNIPITNLLVKRQDTSDTSGKWLTLYSQPITQASDMDFTYIDFLNQHGKTYRYALVPLLTQQQGDVDVEIEGGYTVSDDVLSVFDGVFIANSNGSQKLKAATEYGDLETNQDVGVLTTIGGKYPFVVSNSNLNYHSGSISALIVPSDFYTNGDLDRLDIVERREAIEQFLTDKTAKILKDWNGNIWLITFVENVEVSFVDDYGMGLGTLSAKWVEIGDVNDQTDLQQTGLI